MTAPVATRHRVLALDMPGFGSSDKPPRGRYGFNDFERATDGFLPAASRRSLEDCLR